MNQHLTEEIAERAALYALGALEEPEARAFEEHLAEGCATCCEELQDFEAVAALIGLSAPEATPSPLVRERLLDSVRQESETSIKPIGKGTDAQPNLTVRADEGQWQQIQHGVYRKHLFNDNARGTSTVLIRMEAGSSLPRHRHYGVEECLVLEGDIQAGEERLHAGDYHCAMAESIHERLTTVNGALFLIVGPQNYEVLERL